MKGAIDRGVDVRGRTQGDVLGRLDRIAAEMAEDALPLVQSVTAERYRSILSLCYHYTRASGAQLERAAELAPTDDLREFFASMAEEERDHFRLAEADLAALGSTVAANRPQAVERFAEYWNEIAAENFFEFLGATYVLENIAGRLQDHALAALAVLGLHRRQCRFVLTHLVADAEHGRLARELAARYATEPALVAGAEAAARYWKEGVRAFLVASVD